jgi:hypothetical protein
MIAPPAILLLPFGFLIGVWWLFFTVFTVASFAISLYAWHWITGDYLGLGSPVLRDRRLAAAAGIALLLVLIALEASGLYLLLVTSLP